MSIILGYSFIGDIDNTHSVLGSIKSINYVETSNLVIDELQIKDDIDNPINNIRETWGASHRLLARFQNTLSAGNIDNNGLQISKMVIKRRKTSELNDTILAYVPFSNNSTLTYRDYTQANEKYIYTVSPIASNGAEGFGNPVTVESDFVGYFLVDVDTNDTIIPCDKGIGNVGEAQIAPNYGRIQLDTLGRYPKVYYTNQNYKTVSLSTVLIPSEDERSNSELERIETVINRRKPILLKGSNGMIAAGDVVITGVRNPQNSHKGYDWIQMDLEFTELMSVDEFMKLNIKDLTV